MKEDSFQTHSERMEDGLGMRQDVKLHLGVLLHHLVSMFPRVSIAVTKHYLYRSAIGTEVCSRPP